MSNQHTQSRLGKQSPRAETASSKTLKFSNRRLALAFLIGGISDVIGAFATPATWPIAARAQQSDRTRRIGILMTIAANDPESQARIVAFAQSLQALGPRQLSGYGRSDRSSKLTRGLTTKPPAGFRPRRERCREPTLVTSHYASFASYKPPRVHFATQRRSSQHNIHRWRSSANGSLAICCAYSSESFGPTACSRARMR